LAVGVFLAYLPLTQNSFISCDDGQYITSNGMVSNGLRWPSIIWAFTTMHSANWHPVTWLSHMLDCQLWGLNPTAHHLTNLALHILNTMLLFLLMQRMTGRLLASALVAAVFGLHPVHVESVAWAAERKDVLSTLFFIATIGFYVSYIRARSRFGYFLVIVSYALGLLSKPMLVTLPFVLLLLDYWPLGTWKIGTHARPQSLGARLREKAPLFAMAAASCVITFIAQRAGGAVASAEALPIGLRLCNSVVSYVLYLRNTFWPARLAIFYPAHVEQIAPLNVMLSALLLAGISAAALIMARSNKAVIVGWLWFLGMLVPVIGIVQVGVQSMADRYLYLPMIGLTIMVAYSIPHASIKSRRVATVGGSVILVGLGILTFRQVQYWKDGVVLFKHSLEVTGNNAFAQTNLGAELAIRHELEASLNHFQQAIVADPAYSAAYAAQGRALLLLGRYDDAEESLRQADLLNPKDPTHAMNLGDIAALRQQQSEAAEYYRKSLALDPEQPDVEYNLAMALFAQGDLAGTEAHLRRVLQLDPKRSDAHYQLALLLIRRGQEREAEQQLRQSMRLHYQAPQVHFDLAMLKLRQGKTAECVQSLREAIRIDKNFLPAVQNLAWILCTSATATAADVQEGLKLAGDADELTHHRDPVVLDTFAAAYAANGQFTQAIVAGEHARDLAKSTQNARLSAELEQRLAMYRAGKRYVDPSISPR
jgi:tetratricopeptide (TPR) repeat protein